MLMKVKEKVKLNEEDLVKFLSNSRHIRDLATLVINHEMNINITKYFESLN